jgi:RNA polymerase sigma-70 factor (ECF subfamily)
LSIVNLQFCRMTEKSEKPKIYNSSAAAARAFARTSPSPKMARAESAEPTPPKSASGARRPEAAGKAGFATTHWSVVRAAGHPASPGYRQALETLCKTYWFPLYAYMRRHGYDRHDAEDYTQEFFARLLDKHALRVADPKQGRFRSFLLGALKHFLANERDRIRAKKRGGGQKILSIDFDGAEGKYALEPVDRLTPEKVFERSWALTVLQQVMAGLQAEMAGAGKGKLFEHLKGYLTGDIASVSYSEMARKLDTTEGAIKVAVHRLRKRYRQILRDQIAQTVSSEDQIKQEIRDLLTALAN